MPGGLTFKTSTDAAIPTPASGKVTVYFSTNLNAPAYKNDLGVVYPLTGSQGPQGQVWPLEDGLQGEDGFPGIIGPTGASGSSTVSLATVNLSQAQIEAWATTPIQLVAAPAANQIVIPLHFSVEINVTTLYTVNPNATVSLIFGTDTTSLLSASFNFNLGTASKKLRALLMLTPVSFLNYGATFDPRAKAINLTGSANPSGGGGVATAIVNLFYVTVTTS